MAQYFTDFLEYTPNSAPSDWTERWTASNSDWVVRNDALSPTTARLEHTASVNGRRALSWDDVDSDTDRDDAEILIKFRTSLVSSFQFYFRLRGSGSAGTETSYNALLDAGSLYLHKYDGGASTTLTSTAYAISADTDYWIRFRVQGTALKCRIWADTDIEPGAWTLETTDSSITGVGWAGLGNFESTGTRDFEIVSIATNYPVFLIHA